MSAARSFTFCRGLCFQVRRFPCSHFPFSFTLVAKSTLPLRVFHGVSLAFFSYPDLFFLSLACLVCLSTLLLLPRILTPRHSHSLLFPSPFTRSLPLLSLLLSSHSLFPLLALSLSSLFSPSGALVASISLHRCPELLVGLRTIPDFQESRFRYFAGHTSFHHSPIVRTSFFNPFSINPGRLFPSGLQSCVGVFPLADLSAPL